MVVASVRRVIADVRLTPEAVLTGGPRREKVWVNTPRAKLLGVDGADEHADSSDAVGAQAPCIADNRPARTHGWTRVAPAAQDGSWTSSTRVPKAPLGCTKATVVPRDPGRGFSSMSFPPVARTASTAAAQSSTR